jgi:hypothetical protein
VQEVLRSSGQPLDAAMREFMEPRFGHDFSNVRIHNNSGAIKSAQAVNAHAYTVGNNVVFGENKYATTTIPGRELLAHELAHTVQQRAASGSLTTLHENSQLEQDAVTTGREVANGKNASHEIPASAIHLARAPDPEAERQKAIAEANAVIEEIEATEKEDEAPAPAKTKQKPSQFSPGGFTDEEASKQFKESQDRMKLLELALTLAERQARRREFWNDNPSNTSADVQEAFGLDLYWDPKENGFIRQPYVSQQEAVVNADTEAKRAYDAHLWALNENRPEKESALDAVMGFVCRNTNPCAGNMEQIHRDVEGGMSLEEAQSRGMFRILTFGATAMIPGGPSGPIELGPKMGPGGAVPSGDIVPEVGEPAVLDKISPTSDVVEPAKPAASSASAKPVTYVGGEEVSPAKVRAAYRANPASVKKSLSDGFHQDAWEREGGGGTKGETAPIAFRMRDGGIRVNEVRWLAVGELSEINTPQDLKPIGVSKSGPKGKAPAVDPLGKTGEVIDPLAKTGDVIDPHGSTSAPAKPVRETNYTPPPRPKANTPRRAAQGPRGYTPVPIEVVLEAHRINPDVISVSGSTKFHNDVWTTGKGVGKAPVAFRVGDMIRVDIGSLSAAERALLGYSMYIK